MRQAITDAAEGDEIVFNLGSGNETITLASQLQITKALSINGANGGVPIILQVTSPGVSAWRVMQVNASGKAIQIANLTMKGGNLGTTADGGVIDFAAGQLTLDRVTLANGKAYYGGSIRAAGTLLVIQNSLIRDNQATYGGGLYVRGSGNVARIINTTLHGNVATQWGGGLYQSQNSVYLVNATIAGNSANTGGGLYIGSGYSYAANTILVNNTALTAPNVYNSSPLDAYYSWFSPSGAARTKATSPSITTNYTSGDLGAMGDNGGPTFTLAVPEGKPAYRAGGYVYYNATDGFYVQGTDTN